MSSEATTTTTTAGPSNAFKVGIAFVKQYYKTLSSNPELLENFYATTTAYLISHGEGSEPTEPLFSPKGIDHKEGVWGCAPGETMLFEFEDGAIDAQPSATTDGILLVVTASCIFTGENSSVKRRTQFVQTFFLAKMGRNFAVQNDILRFLAPVAAVVSEESVAEASTAAAAAVVQEKTIEVEDKHNDNDASAAEGPLSSVAESESSAPGAGVEESKEEAPEEEEAAALVAVVAKEKKRSNSKEGKGKKNKGNSKQQQHHPTEVQQAPKPAASKPTPGSWASLVVLGGSAPNTPRRAAENITAASDAHVQNGDGSTTTTMQEQAAIADTTKPATAKKKGKDTTKSTDQSNNSQQGRNKRDPDNTLVIKNLDDNVKEQDIVAMFQAFATATKGKIVGTNINHHRSLAFVDYDSVGPVLAALKKHNEKPLEMNGKVLEVDQKTLEQRARRKAAAGANPNNQNGYRPKNHSNNSNNNTGATTGGRGGGDKFNKNDRRRGTNAGR